MRPPLLIAGIIILITLAAAGFHLQATTTDLSRFNPGWHGTAAFFSLADSMGSVIQTGESRFPPQVDRYIIIAPTGGDAAYTAKRVLDGGGTVVIADEEGGANPLLLALGSGMRVIPGNVSSIDMEFASPRTVVAGVATNHTLFSGVETLVFNRPSYIEGGEPLVKSSTLTWIDERGEARPGRDGSLRRYTLIASEEVGAGEVILIADASLFVTTMQEVRRLHDNRQLLFNLLQSDGIVVVDAFYGRPADAEGPAYLIHGIKSAPISTIIIIFILMLCVAVAFKKEIF